MAADHPTCRPPKDAIDVLRLGEDNRWRQDNGRHARAFVGVLATDPTSVIIWVANCSCPYLNGCPLGKALQMTGDKGINTTVDRRRAYHVIPVPKAKPAKRQKRKTK
jgi:hypothetical protein